MVVIVASDNYYNSVYKFDADAAVTVDDNIRFEKWSSGWWFNKKNYETRGRVIQFFGDNA